MQNIITNESLSEAILIHSKALYENSLTLQRIVDKGLYSESNRVANILETCADNGYNANDDFRERKLDTMPLSGALRVLNKEKKAERVRSCGTFLQFQHNGDLTRLKRANFCKHRLCAMCMWRLSLKSAAEISRILNYIKKKEPASRFAFLTLTQRNVYGDELPGEVEKVLKAWGLLTDHQECRRIIKGYVRSLEITHDTKTHITPEMYKQKKSYYIRNFLKIGDENPNYNKYHTHIHIIMHVDGKYSGRLNTLYGRQNEELEWSKRWQSVLGADYKPVVRLLQFKPEKGHGAFELSKYIVKPEDYLFQDEFHIIDTVEVLEKSLFDRTLVAYAGTFRKARKELKIKMDLLDNDLPEETLDGEKTSKSTWNWNFGYRQYFKFNPRPRVDR